jgi:anti-sigma B factor antagonist
MDLKVTTREEGNVTFVNVAGELELDTHTGLRETLIRLATARRPAIVVNLTEVSYVDSTGLGVLIGGEKRANEYGGKFGVVCANEKILRLFRMTGLHRALRIFPSEEEARQGVSPDEA